MCIFCGGQCGVTEFLFAIGLPFLGLYFFRIKNALLKLKNKIIRKRAGAEEIAGQGIKCFNSGELPQGWSLITPPEIESHNLELLTYKTQDAGIWHISK